jgi:hypothetical protein
MKHARISLSALTLGLLGTAAAQGLPSADITVTAQGYEVPAQLPSGYVQLNISNQTDHPAEVTLMKLNPGVSADSVKRQLSAMALVQASGGDSSAAEQAVFNAGELFGGMQEVPPKASGNLIVNLEPGNYVVATSGTNEDQKDPKALADLGYFQTFTVTQSKQPASAPKTDYRVQLADFAISLPPTQVTAGLHDWEVVNAGRQPHFLALSRLKPGYTPDQVMKMLMSDQPPAENPIDESSYDGTSVLSPDKSNIVHLNLQPGTYMAACWITDPKTKMPHAMLGMVRFFEVK